MENKPIIGGINFAPDYKSELPKRKVLFASARLLGGALVWTEEKPRAGGWWWWTPNIKCLPQIVNLVAFDGELNVSFSGAPKFTPLANLVRGWWAGPIEPPEPTIAAAPPNDPSSPAASEHKNL